MGDSFNPLPLLIIFALIVLLGSSARPILELLCKLNASPSLSYYYPNRRKWPLEAKQSVYVPLVARYGIFPGLPIFVMYLVALFFVGADPQSAAAAAAEIFDRVHQATGFDAIAFLQTCTERLETYSSHFDLIPVLKVLPFVPLLIVFFSVFFYGLARQLPLESLRPRTIYDNSLALKKIRDGLSILDTDKFAANTEIKDLYRFWRACYEQDNLPEPRALREGGLAGWEPKALSLSEEFRLLSQSAQLGGRVKRLISKRSRKLGRYIKTVQKRRQYYQGKTERERVQVQVRPTASIADLATVAEFPAELDVLPPGWEDASVTQQPEPIADWQEPIKSDQANEANMKSSPLPYTAIAIHSGEKGDLDRGIQTAIVALRWDRSPRLTQSQLQEHAADAVSHVDAKYNKDVWDVGIIVADESRQYVQLRVRANFANDTEAAAIRSELKLAFEEDQTPPPRMPLPDLAGDVTEVAHPRRATPAARTSDMSAVWQKLSVVLSRSWGTVQSDAFTLIGGAVGVFVFLWTASRLLGFIHGLAPLALFVIIGPIWLGYCGIALQAVRGESPAILRILDGFGNLWQAFLANAVISVLVAIGASLYVVPGLVIAFLFLLTYFYMYDYKLDFLSSLNRSRKMVMKSVEDWVPIYLTFLALWFVGGLFCSVGALVTGPIAIVMLATAYEDKEHWVSGTVPAPNRSSEP